MITGRLKDIYKMTVADKLLRFIGHGGFYQEISFADATSVLPQWQNRSKPHQRLRA